MTLATFTVLAHASFTGSDPPPGAVLEAAPEQLVLSFTEAVELVFSRVVIYDSQGQEQARPQLSYYTPPLQVKVPLQPLPPGTYTVAWKVTSAADGHVTKGAYSFSVGSPSAGSGATISTSEYAPAPAGRVAVRWLGFAALFVWLGSAAFYLLVVQRSTSVTIRARLLRLVRWSAFAAFVCEGFDFVYQAALVAESPFWQGLNPTHWAPLLGVRYGQLGAWRMGLSLLTWLLTLTGAPSRGKALAFTITAVGLLVGRSLVGHGAALGENAAWAVAADVLHLTALSVWLGGLLSILWLWPKLNPSQADHLQMWARWLPRFSNVALTCALIVVGTGLYNTFAHIPRWDVLWTTDYGRSLSAKVLLLLPLLLLAAPNLLWIVPALRRASGTTQVEQKAGQKAAQHLRKFVGLEALLAGVILVFGSLLTLLSPGSATGTPALVPPFARTQSVEYEGQTYSATLRVDPAQVGQGRVQLSIADSAGAAVQAQRVQLRLVYLNQDLGGTRVTLTQQPDGAYALDGSLFGFPGVWKVQAQARFAGKAKDLETEFDVNIADAQGNPGPIPQGLSPEQQAAIERGKAIYQEHCLACHGETGKGDGPAAAALPMPPADISAHLIHQEHDALVEVIKNGFSTGMPAFGSTLQDQQIDDLIDYLRTLEESGSDY
ncbi:MAG TPA: copper resistance protein CopC [Candidatus Bipolaricaulota bacterium]